MKTRPVIKLGDLVKTKRQVVIGSDPFGTINGAGLQGAKDILTRQLYNRDTELCQSVATLAGQAEFQPLEILDGFYLATEPAAHLDTGIAGQKRLDAIFGIELVPQFLAAAEIDPTVQFRRGHAE